MNPLISNLNNLEQLNTLKENYKTNSPIYFHGLTQGIKAHLLLSIFNSLDKNIIFVSENEKRAKEYLYDINNISDIAKYFPAKEINFYNIKAVDEVISSDRMEILIRQANNEKLITITTLDALLNKLSSLGEFNNSFVRITCEAVIDIDKLIEKLINLHYSPTSLVENKGEFAKRGFIIDFWPVNYENPVRIELFDDQVDSLRFFDSKSQRTIEKIDQVTISPLNELNYSNDDYKLVAKEIENEIKNSKLDPSNAKDQKLIDKYKQILAFIKDSGYVANYDLINPYRKENYADFFDYISKDSVLIFDDISRIYDNKNEFDKKFLEDITYQRENGEVFNSFKNLLINPDILYEKWKIFL